MAWCVGCTRAFRRCLRAAFCDTCSCFQRADLGLLLDGTGEGGRGSGGGSSGDAGGFYAGGADRDALIRKGSTGVGSTPSRSPEQIKAERKRRAQVRQKQLKGQMRQAVESWVLSSLAPPLLRALRLQFQKEAAAFEVCLEELDQQSQQHYGIKEDFRCDVMPVVGQLARLASCRTSLEILQVMRDTVRTVTDAVQAHVESMEIDASEFLCMANNAAWLGTQTTDSLVPLH